MEVTLITGASSGIGEALAISFAAQKKNLVLVARNEAKLQSLCESLSSYHGIVCEYIVTDLIDADAAQKIYFICKSNKWHVNLLINNAGIGSSGEFVQNNLQSELEIIQVNNIALVALTHLFLKDMKALGEGSIINIASIIAFIPGPYMAVYAGSKHFVKTFSQSLAEECRPYNIKVMLFSPGYTTSNFMNSPSNDNEWGKVLVSNASSQTPMEVAKELLEAYKQKKEFHISGKKNRLTIFVTKLIPQRIIAKSFAKQK
ncbi:MAG: SDR family NAD(P)-dependent oxidoreductase [Flavobacterium sp.]|nr:SDR family NAD(P)-dependent oxidoreductase [Flavobacterium sp.]